MHKYFVYLAFRQHLQPKNTFQYFYGEQVPTSLTHACWRPCRLLVHCPFIVVNTQTSNTVTAKHQVGLQAYEQDSYTITNGLIHHSANIKQSTSMQPFSF